MTERTNKLRATLALIVAFFLSTILVESAGGADPWFHIGIALLTLAWSASWVLHAGTV